MQPSRFTAHVSVQDLLLDKAIDNELSQSLTALSIEQTSTYPRHIYSPMYSRPGTQANTPQRKSKFNMSKELQKRMIQLDEQIAHAEKTAAVKTVSADEGGGIATPGARSIPDDFTDTLSKDPGGLEGGGANISAGKVDISPVSPGSQRSNSLNSVANSLFHPEDYESLEKYMAEIQDDECDDDSTVMSVAASSSLKSSMTAPPQLDLKVQYHNLGHWKADTNDPKARVLTMKINEEVIFREGILDRLRVAAEKMDRCYWLYCVERIGTTEAMRTLRCEKLVSMLNQLTSAQHHVAVLIAHGRATAISIIEKVRRLRTIYAREVKTNSFVSIYWKEQNYLLKINHDMQFLNEVATMRLWLGFKAQELVTPHSSHTPHNPRHHWLRTHRRTYLHWFHRHEHFIIASWKQGKSRPIFKSDRKFLMESVQKQNEDMARQQKLQQLYEVQEQLQLQKEIEDHHEALTRQEVEATAVVEEGGGGGGGEEEEAGTAIAPTVGTNQLRLKPPGECTASNIVAEHSAAGVTGNSASSAAVAVLATQEGGAGGDGGTSHNIIDQDTKRDQMVEHNVMADRFKQIHHISSSASDSGTVSPSTPAEGFTPSLMTSGKMETNDTRDSDGNSFLPSGTITPMEAGDVYVAVQPPPGFVSPDSSISPGLSPSQSESHPQPHGATHTGMETPPVDDGMGSSTGNGGSKPAAGNTADIASTGGDGSYTNNNNNNTTTTTTTIGGEGGEGNASGNNSTAVSSLLRTNPMNNTVASGSQTHSGTLTPIEGEDHSSQHHHHNNHHHHHHDDGKIPERPSSHKHHTQINGVPEWVQLRDYAGHSWGYVKGQTGGFHGLRDSFVSAPSMVDSQFNLEKSQQKDHDTVEVLVQNSHAAPMFWSTIDHNPLVVEAATGFEECFPRADLVPPLNPELQIRVDKCLATLRLEYRTALDLVSRQSECNQVKERVEAMVKAHPETSLIESLTLYGHLQQSTAADAYPGGEGAGGLASKSTFGPIQGQVPADDLIGAEMSSPLAMARSQLLVEKQNEAQLLRVRQQGTSDLLTGISVKHLSNSLSLEASSLATHLLPPTGISGAVAAAASRKNAPPNAAAAAAVNASIEEPTVADVVAVGGSTAAVRKGGVLQDDDGNNNELQQDGSSVFLTATTTRPFTPQVNQETQQEVAAKHPATAAAAATAGDGGGSFLTATAAAAEAASSVVYASMSAEASRIELDASVFEPNLQTFGSYIDTADFKPFRVEESSKVRQKIEDKILDSRSMIEYLPNDVLPRIRPEKLGLREASRVDPEWEHAHAKTIQRHIRGYLGRRRAKKIRILQRFTKAKRKIETLLRGFLYRVKKREKYWERRMEAFVMRKNAVKKFRASMTLGAFFKKIMRAKRQIRYSNEQARLVREGSMIRVEITNDKKVRRPISRQASVLSVGSGASPPPSMDGAATRQKSGIPFAAGGAGDAGSTGGGNGDGNRNEDDEGDTGSIQSATHCSSVNGEDQDGTGFNDDESTGDLSPAKPFLSKKLKSGIKISGWSSDTSVGSQSVASNNSKQRQIGKKGGKLNHQESQRQTPAGEGIKDSSDAGSETKETGGIAAIPPKESLFKEDYAEVNALDSYKIVKKLTPAERIRRLEAPGPYEETHRRLKVKNDALNLVARVNRGKPQSDTVYNCRLIPSRAVNNLPASSNAKTRKFSTKQYAFLNMPGQTKPESVVTSSEDTYVGPIPKRLDVANSKSKRAKANAVDKEDALMDVSAAFEMLQHRHNSAELGIHPVDNGVDAWPNTPINASARSEQPRSPHPTSATPGTPSGNLTFSFVPPSGGASGGNGARVSTELLGPRVFSTPDLHTPHTKTTAASLHTSASLSLLNPRSIGATGSGNTAVSSRNNDSNTRNNGMEAKSDSHAVSASRRLEAAGLSSFLMGANASSSGSRGNVTQDGANATTGTTTATGATAGVNRATHGAVQQLVPLRIDAPYPNVAEH